MKRISFSFALFLACAGIMPVRAAPVRQATYTIKGKIAGSCAIPQAAPLTLSTTVSSNGKIDPALSNVSWTIAGWSCNAASRISLSARPLRLSPPRTSLTPSQSQVINFTARASGWTTADATVTTAETNPLGTSANYTGAAQVQNAPRKASITVRVGDFATAGAKGNSANNAKPVDGAYSATITVTLTPSS
jgi:hypothetical protein